MRAVVIGIGGGSGSGKTTLAELTLAAIAEARLLSFDAYYRDLGHLPHHERTAVNFDHPDSLDDGLFVAHLDALAGGSAIEVPEYDFVAYTRTGRSHRVEPAPVIVVEGVLLYAFPAIVDRIDHRVFIDVPEPVRFARRRDRDVKERGRTAENVARQFAETVAPMHDEHVQPSMAHAHRVVRLGEPYAAVAADLALLVEAATAAT